MEMLNYGKGFKTLLVLVSIHKAWKNRILLVLKSPEPNTKCILNFSGWVDENSGKENRKLSSTNHDTYFITIVETIISIDNFYFQYTNYLTYKNTHLCYSSKKKS